MGDTDGAVTLREVAVRAGVSVSTASLAFRQGGPITDSTRSRILAIADELGYGGPNAMASSLKSGRSSVIGVYITSRIQAALQSPVMLATFDGLSSVLDEQGYAQLLLPVLGTGPQRRPSVAWPMAAAAILSRGEPLNDLVAALRARRVPAIAIEGSAELGVPTVDIDHEGGMRLIGEHLASLGHRRIGVILRADRSEDDGSRTGLHTPTVGAEGIENIDNHAVRQRLAGILHTYPDAVKIAVSRRDSSAGKQAALELLAADPGLTAIAAQSDVLAVGAVHAVESLGLRVPLDISVTGFDGVEFNGFDRTLTTVAQPLEERGRVAARHILDSIAGRPVSSVTLPTSLRIGDTTGPAREGSLPLLRRAGDAGARAEP